MAGGDWCEMVLVRLEGRGQRNAAPVTPIPRITGGVNCSVAPSHPSAEAKDTSPGF